MPRFGLISPHDGDPERAQLVQAYMVLHAKQTSVRRRLSSPSSVSPTSSATSSPDLSPRNSLDESQASPFTRHNYRHSTPASPRSHSQRSNNLRRPSVPSIPETHEEHDIDSDEGKLCDINERIKVTLSKLMDCESVKRDDRMRSWVQSRLESQQTVTSHRRHSSTSSMPQHRSSVSSPQGWVPSYADSARLAEDAEGEQVRKLSI
ncbi:hypothetical protein K461DRAFT_289363 [Myriangium duriaei CBS 260.36]|uniref:Uncharacterized protein n=1 Tax=Myriangium duriaei CBS 260.36 TaxID=1168546 RepID=A0A9P4ML68_9PEZI|nr:hypothetical protein K461DRAFT_289363 [Myriangium duriaei CBS 260.36]